MMDLQCGHVRGDGRADAGVRADDHVLYCHVCGDEHVHDRECVRVFLSSLISLMW